MSINEQTIQTFYTCFQKKDYKGMQACYADDATFSDSVFVGLNAAQVRAMWEMLIRRGKDLQLEFSNVFADAQSGSAQWVATYTFSATGHKVINRIQARFEFRDGKIIRHTDSFDFYTWARQALGVTGLLLGWTSFLKNKVRQGAMKNLAAYMEGPQ